MYKSMPRSFKSFLVVSIVSLVSIFMSLQCHSKLQEAEFCADDYLSCNINESDASFLNLYYDSFERPEVIKNSFTDWRQWWSPQAKALYIFSQNNLIQFSGITPLVTEEALAIGRQYNIDWIIAEAYFYEAQELYSSQQLIQSESLLNDVLEMVERIGYNGLKGRVYNLLGNISFDQTNLKKALKYYQIAYQLFDGNKYAIQMCIILNNISTVYIHTEDWKNADIYSKRSLKVYQNHNFSNSLTEAILYTNASVIDTALGREESQQRNVELAFDRAMKTGSKQLQFKTMVNLADNLLNQGETEDALDIMIRCLSLAREESNPLFTAYCQESLAEVYLAKIQLELAILSAKEAVGIYTDHNNVPRIIYATDILSRIYEQKGRYDEALFEYKKMATLEKKLILQSREKEALSLKNQFDRKLDEQELLLLSAKNDIQKLQIQAQEFREWLYFLLFIIISFVSLISYRKYKKFKIKHSTLQQDHAKLEVESTHDPLTDLYNRRYLDTWFSYQEETTNNKPHLLAIIDVDYFKKINDQYGHEAGDEVLRALSTILKQQLRPEDLLMRWGGEEFVMIISTPEAHIKEVLERIRAQVEQTSFYWAGQRVPVTVSIGAIAEKSVSKLALSWQSAMESADQALYQAKSEGRNRFIVNDSYQ